MCGIAGVLRIHPPGERGAPGEIPHPLEAIPEAWLDTLDDSIIHRGPDGEGRFRDRATRPDGTVVDIAFVHRRLSIIDHAGGTQPMVHDGTRLRPDLVYHRREEPKLAHELCRAGGEEGADSGARRGLVAVVFNGCIYNHRQQRAELEALGHTFGTDHSDTEVLIHGWREWGLYIQDQLDAMYAALVWDRRTGQLAWGRDLAGEKPLYQGWVGDRIVFASACAPLPLLVAEDRSTPVPWRDVLPRWVRLGADPWSASDESGECRQGEWECSPHCPNRGARAAIPAPSTSVRRNRRAGLPSRGERHPCNITQANQGGRVIHAAVASRLEADVPLGVFLSGGIDSGLIAAIAKHHAPDIRAFTVRMPDPRIDESEAAAETARAIAIDHTILDCEPTPAADLVHLIHQLGLPFGDSSLLPTYWVCKAAREHVKVALAGDGGDELFGGYRRHVINPMLNRRRRLLALIPASLLPRRTPGSRSEYLARLAVAAKHGGYRELLSIFPTPDLRQLIPLIEGVLGEDEFEPIDDPLRHDFMHYLPDDLLRKTDTASMAVALEVRAPFLARELVEAALRTPLSVLMPGGERKGLLKQVARRYLPDHIVDRPKQGFAIPIGAWFRSDFGGMRQLLFDHLESADPFPGLAEAGVDINMAFVRRMLREHDAAGEPSINPWHGRDHAQRLYMLLVLSIWARWLARAIPDDAPGFPSAQPRT